MAKNFALTGVSGYIAPRHLKAIKDTGNFLIAAVDPHDSAGILDSYFEGVRFFTEFERFDRHIEMLRRKGENQRVHYVSICSPNYLHDAHARFALRVGADAICEKPLVLNPWNVDALAELENEFNQRIFTILQLRVHPSLVAIKEKLEKEPPKTKNDIRLTYVTSRGPWYLASWKGQIERSGGLPTNIGIHFFDLLIWLFGRAEFSEVHVSTVTKIGGYIELANARVQWFLSIDKNDVPAEILAKGQRTYRSITINGEEIEFSGGFTDLHTMVYQRTLDGHGFGLEDARPSIELVHKIRNAKEIGINLNTHPFLRKSGGQ
ncbi:MAG: oxidoreductase [candidate division Zixibacteria bacterium HGW-Zixibacteria-1]|nr:MAG: oxidoreductase [candidate division Zixibacteria bacterium HGW-Zixibacteria-1]